MSYPFTATNNPSQTATKPVTPETLPAILYHDVRVITTDLLAQLYGADAVQIRQNHSNNRDRFVEGKHFFKLEGEALRQFKELHKVDSIDLVEISPRAKHFTLWTERGAARHAKMINTDQAWDVFERLEDAYFKPREARAAFGTGPQGEMFDVPVDPALLTKTFGTFIRLAKLGGLEPDPARQFADRETFKRLGVSPLAILNVDAPANQPSYTVTDPPDGPAMLTASALLQRHGSEWSAIAFNRAMAHVGYLEYRSVERLNKPAMRFSVLIDEGLSYGENVKYNDRYPTTSPLYYHDRFPALLEIIEPVMEEQMRSEVEALDGDTSQMTRKQRQLYKDSGLKAQRKAEKIEQRIERLLTMADEGETWTYASKMLNLDRHFDADERYQLRVQFAERQGKPKPARIAQDPGRALPASLQPVDREAANNPDWLEPKDLIDPAVREDYKARNQYQPVSREQARAFLIEEAQKFLAVGDDWETFCYMRGRLFPMAFNDAEVLSLRQAYDRAFPTGDPLNWSGAV